MRQTLPFIRNTPIRSELPRYRCFKTKRGEVGKCSESPITDTLPGTLVDTYEQLALDDSLYAEQADRLLSKLLSLCERDNAVCRQSFMTFLRKSKEVSGEKYKIAISKIGTELISTTSHFAHTYYEDIAKLVYLSQLTNDSAYFEEAQKRLDAVLEISKNDPDNPVIYHDVDLGSDIRRFDCGLYGSTYLSLYQVTNDSKYLEKSRKFFSNMPRYSSRYGNLLAFDACLSGLTTLVEDIGDRQYSAYLKDALTYGLQAYWDAKQTPKFTSDQGLLLSDYSISLTNQAFNFKHPKEHAWFLSFVVKFPDATFNLPGSNL